MPMFDLTCDNNHEQVDLLLKLGERPPCPECGLPTRTLWRTSSSVMQDSIEGGIWIRHGLVGPNGEPQKFYSKSEIAREAKRRGLANRVEHVTGPGTDKALHTKKWF